MLKRTTISLADLAHTYSAPKSSLTVPLNIAYIKAALLENHKNLDVNLFKNPEDFIKNVNDVRPDIIGFANYGWNENLNKEIGIEIRSNLPEIIILAGGPNIDPDPDNRKDFMKSHDYVDYFIIDGGEQPLSDFIHWWQNKNGDKS